MKNKKGKKLKDQVVHQSQERNQSQKKYLHRDRDREANQIKGNVGSK